MASSTIRRRSFLDAPTLLQFRCPVSCIQARKVQHVGTDRDWLKWGFRETDQALSVLTTTYSCAR